MLKYRLYFFFYYLCGISYILAGVNHFVNPNLIRPKSQLRVWSAWGIVLLLIAVYPANIYSYTHLAELGDPRATIALIRLPFQLLFLWWAWVYTRPFPKRPE